MDYFQLFGLTPTFQLDTNQLTQTYQTLQKSVHPDRFAHASSQEQLVAVQKSSMINDAYQTLKLPLKRAEYLLSMRGTELPNEQASFQDTAFLMRQMELREMLGDIQSAANVDDAIFAASQELESEYQSLFVEMQKQLEENTSEANQQASESVRKLKFYQKLQHELDRIEDLIFDD